jgi:glycosyltransferase involved in cell wall biosynthesis
MNIKPQSVAIVIPCRNEELYIEKCINSILTSNYPLDLIHVYVCDGKSEDSTQEIVRSISKDHPQVHLLINEKKTTPFALNLGLKKSKEAFKIILGAHAEVYPDFIKENINAFDSHPDASCAGGVIENVYENKTAEIVGLAMSSPFGVGNAHFRTGGKDGFVDTVAFGAYKKEVFDDVGYFDEELARNQDDEFNYRLLKNGFKIYLSKKIRSKYYVRASYSKLFKQYLQYGYWKVFVNKKHQTVTTIRQMVPLFFVLFLFAFPLVLFDYRLAMLWSFGGLLYIFLASISALKQTKQLSKIIMVVGTFFILHFSYGFGYLKGIVEFVFLGKGPSKKAENLTR